eukprot:1258744-Rhodomonas_salina.3
MMMSAPCIADRHHISDPTANRARVLLVRGADLDQDFVAADHARLEGDGPLFGELDRVAQQVRQDLPSPYVSSVAGIASRRHRGNA